MDQPTFPIPSTTRALKLYSAANPAPALRSADFSEPRDDLSLASFWIAGYEGPDRINTSGLPLSRYDLTQHTTQASADYARLAAFGMRTVRESVGWHQVERQGRFDFSGLKARAQAARDHGIQVIWTLCHYGWPSDIDVFSTAFVERFARYARATAQYLADVTDAVPVYVPINEISYLSWVLSESGRMHPQYGELKHRGKKLKHQLVRAALAACDAIHECDARARFMHTDPLMHIVAPAHRPDLTEAAARLSERQFETWDMLCGRIEPQLGGHAGYLDVVGANYYYGNQWELATGRTLGWRRDDIRRRPLSALLQNLYQRYAKPIVIAETSHMGSGTTSWLTEIASETARARTLGIPVEGICLQSVLAKPNWERPTVWQHDGLWNLVMTEGGVLQRQLNVTLATALRKAQRSMTTIKQPHGSRLTTHKRQKLRQAYI